jgi:hypothetical protein
VLGGGQGFEAFCATVAFDTMVSTPWPGIQYRCSTKRSPPPLGRPLGIDLPTS